MEPADYDWLTDARYEVPRRRRRSPRRSSRTLFGEYVSLPDSPTRQSGLPFTTFGGMGSHMGWVGRRVSKQPRAGRQASAAHAFSSWLSHRLGPSTSWPRGLSLMQICISSTRFPSSLPTTQPTGKRSKGACLLALMWRALECTFRRRSGLLGRIRQIRPTLDSAASRYAILDALCAARQCQARRLASHRPSVDCSWVESIAE